MVGKKVTMLVDDTWAKPGWTGIITDVSRNSNVRVRWDNGKTFSHRRRHVGIINSEDDPNVAFLVQKFKKKGFKV